MITLNTDGRAISQTFIDKMTDAVSPYLMRLLLNGTVLDCAIKKVQIIKGSVGVLDAFNIGSVISSTMIAEVTNLTTAVKGKTIDAQIGFLIDETNQTYEYISLGKFTVSEANQTIYSTTLTAYGACVSKTVRDFVSPQDKTPPKALTLENIADEIEAETGVTVSFGNGIDTTKELVMPMSGLTTYQALQALTESVGGYAVDTYAGNIAIRLFDDTPTAFVASSRMRSLPNADEYNFEVTGVKCETPAGAFTSGNVNLITESYWVCSEIFDDYANGIIGYSYRPASLGLTLGDPRLEGDDVVQVTDADGNIYNVPCHQIVHTYTGGLTTQIDSAQATQIANKIATTVSATAEDGESAVTLRIDSSRGTVFKNAQVSTVLNVAIYYKGYRITDSTALRDYYNFTAHLQWFYQGFDEDEWHTLASSDPRLSNDGFTLTLTPQDVDTKIVFQCNLLTN